MRHRAARVLSMVDISAWRSLVPEGMREKRRRWLFRRRAIAHYQGLLKPGELVFDVGAHHGEWTDVFVKVGMRVVAFEPQPELAAALAKRVTVEAVALGRGEGTTELTFGISGADGLATVDPTWPVRLSRSGRFQSGMWSGRLWVRVSTLDAMIDRHGVPSYCKIDAEGSDAEILAGLSQPLPLVSFEYLPEGRDLLERCVAELRRLGAYEFAVSPGLSFDLSGWVSASKIPTLLDNQDHADVYARLI
jgi:FkbM family methyltransferase